MYLLKYNLAIIRRLLKTPNSIFVFLFLSCLPSLFLSFIFLVLSLFVILSFFLFLLSCFSLFLCYLLFFPVFLILYLFLCLFSFFLSLLSCPSFFAIFSLSVLFAILSFFLSLTQGNLFGTEINGFELTLSPTTATRKWIEYKQQLMVVRSTR